MATTFVTFGLIENVAYTQYMYRIYLGLIFRVPFINIEDISWTRLALETPGYLPPNWERLSLTRNQIDDVLLTTSRHLFAYRLSLLLQADSSLPMRLRFPLRGLDPKFLLIDDDLKARVCSYLSRLFKSESRRRQPDTESWKQIDSLCINLL